MSADEGEQFRIRAAYAKRRNDGRYSWFAEGHAFLAQERERRVLSLLKREGFSSLARTRILEIGCGTGYWMREFINWGARPENITGIDLLPDRVAEAKNLCPPAVQIECVDAAKLAMPDRSFDLVLQSTVVTSILDHEMRRRVASQMLRVVKPQGLIVWYDFRVDNPWNADVRGVPRAEIRQLFPRCRVELQTITLIPALARAVAPYSWLGCHLLSCVPWLNTHYLGAIRPSDSQSIPSGAVT